MKKSTLLLFSLAFILMGAHSSKAQWQLTGFDSRNIKTLYANGNDIFVCIYNGGDYLSKDSGTTWTAINHGLNDSSEVNAFLQMGSKLFAVTSNYGIFVSSDTGANWTFINDTNLTTSSFSCLAVSGSNLFAGSYDAGVYLSKDTGKSWTTADSGLTENIIYSLASGGNHVYAGTPSGVFLTTNNGTTWAQVNNGLTGQYIYPMIATATSVFAVSSDGLFSSSDNGANWAPAYSGITDYLSIYSLAASGTIIVAGTFSDVFVSVNNGTNWNATNLDSIVPAVAISGDNVFAGAGQHNSNASSGLWKLSVSYILPAEQLADNVSMTIYPNPASNQLYIRTSSFKDNNEQVTIFITDVLGKETSPPAPLRRRGEISTIDINALPKGLYFLRIESESRAVTKMFVKE